MEDSRIKEIEEQIADLKARWPAHSVPPAMWMQLEELEAKLEEAKASRKKMNEGIFDARHAPMLDNPGRVKELRPQELLKNVVGVIEGMTCIDFGSGTGTFALPLAELVGDKGKVYAVDNSAELLEHIKSKNPPPNLIPVHSDVTQTGLNDSTADICLMAFILHELSQPGSLIKEAYRLLKPEGRLVILEWKVDSDTPRPPRNRRISREQIVQLFQQAGLTLQSYEDWNKNHYLATGIK
jgi:ubiquinone/menaquinone biosynthesis C-methylase UbiE